MNHEIVKPRLSNFIKSLRDVGYTFEIAIADVVDNSISAGAKNIKIRAVAVPNIVVEIFDDGRGMSSDELVEAGLVHEKSLEFMTRRSR